MSRAGRRISEREDYPDMAEADDLQVAAEEIAMAADLVETSTLDAGRDLFDFGTKNAVIEGNVPAGATILGQGAVLIQGDVRGGEASPCRIETAGDVVVTGAALQAQIVADNIYIGGDVQHCGLTAVGSVRIDGNALAARLVGSECKGEIDRWGELQKEITAAVGELILLERRLPLEEARTDRLCRDTSIPLDFSVGGLIQHEGGAVHFKLDQFFASVGEKSEEQLNNALAEFFAKGIIGVVARKNRKYIDNQAREIVFMRLLKNLRELYMQAARKYRLEAQLAKYRAEMDGLLMQLEERERVICIKGDCDSSCKLAFRVPEVKRLADGTVECSDRTVSLWLRPGSDIAYWELHIWDAAKGQSEHRLAESRNLAFRLNGGKVTCSQLVEKVVPC